MTRIERMLAIAARIVQLENTIALLRADFFRLANEKSSESDRSDSPRPPGRPRKLQTIAERVLLAFGADVQLPAGEIVHRLKDVRVEVVHSQLSKLTAAGKLQRVAWGVYRRAA